MRVYVLEVESPNCERMIEGIYAFRIDAERRLEAIQNHGVEGWISEHRVIE